MHDNTLGTVSRSEADVVHPKALKGGPASGLGSLRNRISRRVDEALLGLCQKALRNSVSGALRLTLPSGSQCLIGRGDSNAAASLELRSYRVLWNALRRGSIGFAESYMAEDACSDDLLALFGFFIANKQALQSAGRGQFRVRWRIACNIRSAATRAPAASAISKPTTISAMTSIVSGSTPK